MNFLLRNLFFIFVLAFLIVDSLFLFSGTSTMPEELNIIIRSYIIYIPIVAILQVLVLSGLAYLTSIKPIRSLKKEIAFFLTGSKQ